MNSLEQTLLSFTDKIYFPYSFTKTVHKVVPGATQWLYKRNGRMRVEEDVWISVVGGGVGLYGDGEETFELWDNKLQDVLAWRTKEEINAYLDEEYNRRIEEAE